MRRRMQSYQASAGPAPRGFGDPSAGPRAVGWHTEPGGGIPGAEPGADSTGAQTQRPAKTRRNPQGACTACVQAPRARRAKKSNKIKPGRTRARTGAGSEWECHVEIEWIQHWLPTPHFGGLGAGRRRGSRAPKHPRRSEAKMRHRPGL